MARTKERPADDTDSLGPDERVVPTWTQGIARQASAIIGGPLGRHASVGRHWLLTPVRVILGFCVLMLMLSWFLKAGCLQQYADGQGILQLDWRGDRQYVAMCYSDLHALYTGEHLNTGGFPYKTMWTVGGASTAMDYPVISGLFQWISAQVSHFWLSIGLPSGLPMVVFFDIAAFFLAVAWIITVWATVRTATRRPWDGVLVALAPVVLFQAFTNFDTIATAFVATGILAWARKRPVLAGVLLGLGAATKWYPLLLLIPLIVLAWRAGKVSVAFKTALTTLITLVVVNLPFAILYPHGWSVFFRSAWQQTAGLDSVYNIIAYANGSASPNSTALDILSILAITAVCVGVVVIAITAGRRPRFAQLAFLIVAGFLLFSKVYNPQYSLWLIPLAALAIPRWNILIPWMALDALVWVPRMFYYATQAEIAEKMYDRGLPEPWFLTFVSLRDLALLAICGLVVWEIYRPDRDMVRGAGDDDPTGGVLDGQQDHERFSRRYAKSAETPADGVSSMTGAPADETTSTST